MHSGRTYTLTDHIGDSTLYYQLVRELAERLLEIVPGETALRERIRNASTLKGIFKSFPRQDRHITRILHELDGTLSPFLTGVDEHLRSLSVGDRLDPTIRTSRRQYLLYILEIELTNRINLESFSKAPWRISLIAHCLRDFRNDCRSRREDVEETCTYCNPDCLIKRGSELLKRYQVHPFISVSMDHRSLFKQLVEKHPGMGVLGVACIPELITGMRLCEKLGIPAVGVPLDANRCSRWLEQCKETTLNLEEMERLVKPGPGA